jgi:hypothetical protein
MDFATKFYLSGALSLALIIFFVVISLRIVWLLSAIRKEMHLLNDWGEYAHPPDEHENELLYDVF